MSYFVIRCTADGLTFDGPMAALTLETRLTENYYGANVRFASKVPPISGFALMLDENELIVIQGDIIRPEPVATVTKWTVR